MDEASAITERLPAELEHRVRSIAAALGQSRAAVIEQAVQQFVDTQEWHLAAIDAGIHAADAGQVVAHEDVVRWVDSWGKPDELPMPTCM